MANHPNRGPDRSAVGISRRFHNILLLLKDLSCDRCEGPQKAEMLFRWIMREWEAMPDLEPERETFPNWEKTAVALLIDSAAHATGYRPAHDQLVRESKRITELLDRKPS